MYVCMYVCMYVRMYFLCVYGRESFHPLPPTQLRLSIRYPFPILACRCILIFRAFMLSEFQLCHCIECAKLRALHAYVPTCVPYVLRCQRALRAYVLTCQHVLLASMPTCLPCLLALHACLLTYRPVLRAYVLCVLTSYVPTCCNFI